MDNVAPLHTQNVVANDKGQMTMLSLMMNESAMANIERMAGMLASSRISVPEHLRNNQSDCFAICLQAIQWGMNPFAVAQKTHLVKGTLGYEAQLVNAVITNSGVVKGRFDYEFIGPWEKVIGKVAVKKNQKDGKEYTYRVPNWTPQDEEGCGVIVTAALANGEIRTRQIMLSQALTRNSTLWADDPQQQLAYLGVKRWARMYTPDVIMGVYTADELEERELNPVAPETKDTMADLKVRAEQARREARAAEKAGTVIEAEAESAAPESKTEETENKESMQEEILDLYRDCLSRMDLAQSGQELKDITQEITDLGSKLSRDQKMQANESYKKNIKRLNLRK
jgi:hypothetical protein